LQSYKQFISQNFPLNDQPEIFGLHKNAEIRSGIKETDDLFGTLLNLLPRRSSKKGESVDIIIKRKASDYLENIPPEFDLKMITKKFPINYMNSMNIVLVQEIIRYNRLTLNIKTSL